MRYLPLLLSNLRRKKLRTVLTIGSFAVALCLFGVLAAVRSGFRQGIDVAGADRVVVIGRTSLIQPLPMTYFERIKRIPGVKDVAQWKDFLADRQGCIVGAKLAQRFGWKVGDRIPLKPPPYFGEGSWEFNVRGIYQGTRRQDDETQFWFQHRYLYEKAPEFWRTIVGWYVVRVANPDQALRVARAIDDTFANSPGE